MQSHIIRAPLSRIIGLIQLLDVTNPDTGDFKQIINYIQKSAFELDEVIRNITDKSIAVNYKI
jgi:signal transduction histidine kinase